MNMMTRQFSNNDIKQILAYILNDNPLKKYCPFSPFDTQKRLLRSTKKEILFSGSAANGKTVASLMAALRDVNNKYYNCLIIRNTYKDLSQPGCQIPVSKQWLSGTDAQYNETLKQWIFPSGAKIAFGYMEHELDKLNYRSSEYSRIIFDEASLIEPESIKYMHSRLRVNKESGLKTQMVLFSNPGGPSHHYLKERFIDNKDPEREYIHSTFKDNPTINHKEYEENLKNLTEIEYRQLALGEWILDENQNMYHVSEKNIINPLNIIFPTYIMGIDLGYNDDSAITIMGHDNINKKIYVVFSKKFPKSIVSDIAIFAKELHNEYNPQAIVVDSAGPGKMITEELARRYDLPAKSAQKQEKEAFIKLLNADLEHCNLYIYNTCTDLLTELKSLQKNKYGKENQNQSNHAADAFLYAYKESRHYKNTEPAPKKTNMDQWEEQLVQYNQIKENELWE